jgi:glutamine amidotransferase
MHDLQDMGLDEVICEFYKSGRPFLGICLGAQIIMEESEENRTACLGLVAGSVKRFSLPLRSPDGRNLKVPHMGWNRVTIRKHHPVFSGIDPQSEFYFVHSFYPAPRNADAVLGITDHGLTFTSVLGERNLIAVQFHPEKSGAPGLTLLKNFCMWDGGL